jgi:hypothetical protein
LKNPSQKRAGGVTHGVGPEFKPQYWREKKKSLSYFSKGKEKIQLLSFRLEM